MDLIKILQFCIKQGASDIHFHVDRAPVMRLHGSLVPLKLPLLTPERVMGYVTQLCGEEELAKFTKNGGTDFGYTFEDKGRFRVSVFRDKGNPGIVMRLIPKLIMSLEEIGLPTNLTALLERDRGLILVTGPTGSGKTTTMAAMLDYINANFDRHIVTIEDPIEFYHDHKKGIITQREIGRDVPDFSTAIIRALRMDPDVILVGEMRDLETIHAAITAAETGHLVMATLHTTGAARTVDRIIDAFPTERQGQIRSQLSLSLAAVISQVLIPRIDQPGRVAAFEIMINTSAVENNIRENKTFKIPSSIQTGKRQGMILLDDSLKALNMQGIISWDEVKKKLNDNRLNTDI